MIGTWQVVGVLAAAWLLLAAVACRRRLARRAVRAVPLRPLVRLAPAREQCARMLPPAEEIAFGRLERALAGRAAVRSAAAAERQAERRVRACAR